MLASFGLVLLLTLEAQTQTTTTAAPPTTPAPSTASPTTFAPVSTSTVAPGSTTTLTPEQQCRSLNKSCDTCVSDPQCMFCFTDKVCRPYPIGKVLPPSELCALDEARWGVCWMNFEALIISMSVIGGVILLTITVCCCYCCCCRGKNTKKFEREDARYESQKMERKEKQDERRSERRSRLDDIRRKYGLMKDDTQYERFDQNA